MRRKEDAKKKDHLRLTTRAQRIFKRRCTFVPPLYFGSKNAATRPIVTRVSCGSSFSRLILSLFFFLLNSLLSLLKYRDLPLSFSFNEQRLHAFALTAFQFVRIPLPFSINYLSFISLSLSFSQFSIISCRPSMCIPFPVYRSSNYLPGCR